MNLLFILAFVGILWFLLIRPQMKRQKEHTKLLGSLEKGDKVITSGGIHGIIVGLADETVTLQIAEGTKVELTRVNIAAVLK